MLVGSVVKCRMFEVELSLPSIQAQAVHPRFRLKRHLLRYCPTGEVAGVKAASRG